MTERRADEHNTRERIAWLNGEFVGESKAHVSIFDRGFLFGDGVYDVATVVEGKLLDADHHLARLGRSCDMIRLVNPYSEIAWLEMLRELVARNGLREGLVYAQITRGPAERDFAFPVEPHPTAMAYARSKVLVNDPTANGVRVVTVPDIRWDRRDIKSVSLLAQVLAKQAAREAGAFEAVMHEDGVITEGSSSNVYLVRDGVVVTAPLTQRILAGVTRRVVLELANQAGIRHEERPFTVQEAQRADEVFLTSATTFLVPVIQVDAQPIGNGAPGPIARLLRAMYVARALAQTTDMPG